MSKRSFYPTHAAALRTLQDTGAATHRPPAATLLYPSGLASSWLLYYLCPHKNRTPVNLYLFNPENDLAVAFGGINYTPPPAAQRIGRELAILPLWYADNSAQSTIVTPDELPADFLHAIEPLGLEANAITLRELDGPTVKQVHVWGWNHDLAKRLRSMGIDENLLPSAPQCDTLRRLSHRRFAAEAGRFLCEQIDYPFPQPPVELHTPDEVKAFTEQSERKVLKAPWSGSGRGLYWNLYGYDTALAQWSNGVLQKQGVLMGEPVYDKTGDWAMEFFSDGTQVTFAGYSAFLTDGHGAYKENRLAGNDVLEQELATTVGMEIVTTVKQSLLEFLTIHVAPHYTGYFGIDMMTYRNPQGTVLLHPFVEINLRMNMGMVARRIADRFLVPYRKGVYRVDYFPKTGELYRDHMTRQTQYPIQISNGKFESGYFALTPVFPHSRYRASIQIEES